jgi:hypothetical protein
MGGNRQREFMRRGARVIWPKLWLPYRRSKRSPSIQSRLHRSVISLRVTQVCHALDLGADDFDIYIDGYYWDTVVCTSAERRLTESKKPGVFVKRDTVKGASQPTERRIKPRPQKAK